MIANIADWLLLSIIAFILVSLFLLRKNKFSKKFFMFIITVIALTTVYLYRNTIILFLKDIPFVWNIINPFVNEVSNGTLLGLIYLTSFGALFFISIPVEISFIYYLTLGHNPLILILVAVSGSLVGLSMNYVIGLLFGEKVFKYLLKNKFDNFKESINKYGGAIILFGNLIPFPSELFSAVLGSVRYNFRKFLIYTLIGRTIKFSMIFFAKDYFTESILPFLKSIIK